MHKLERESYFLLLWYLTVCSQFLLFLSCTLHCMMQCLFLEIPFSLFLMRPQNVTFCVPEDTEGLFTYALLHEGCSSDLPLSSELRKQANSKILGPLFI